MRMECNGHSNELIADGSGNFRIDDNGTERLRIKSNGQIVLGSDGSNSELTFSQDGSTGVILNSTTTGFGGYNTFTVNSAQFVHKYGGNERLRIGSDGPHLFLGGTSSVNEITETSSSSGLVIGNTSMGNGGLAIINSTTGTGRIYFGDNSGSDDGRKDGFITYSQSTRALSLGAAQGERINIGSAGQFGVAGAGGTSVLDGYIKGIVTGFTGTTADVKVLEHVSTAGTVTNVNYQNGGVYNFATGIISISAGLGTDGDNYPVGAIGAGRTVVASSVTDWFEQQNIVLTQTDTNGNPLKLEWDALADRPSTSTYVAARGGRFDELHVVVIAVSYTHLTLPTKRIV